MICVLRTQYLTVLPLRRHGDASTGLVQGSDSRLRSFGCYVGTITADYGGLGDWARDVRLLWIASQVRRRVPKWAKLKSG